jgi:small subunit ribosomal protein S1
VHKGTIISGTEKGFIVTLPYGVEGFCPMRHAMKEDNTPAKVDDTLEFKVIEFSKENKKIILSHTKVFQDTAYSEKARQLELGKSEAKSTRRAVKKLKDSLEKTTLGDFEALANLKSDLEKTEKKEKEVKKNPKKEKTE